MDDLDLHNLQAKQHVESYIRWFEAEDQDEADVLFLRYNEMIAEDGVEKSYVYIPATRESAKTRQILAEQNRDVKITEEGNGRDFNLSPENAPESLRARKELLDVAMEAAAIRLKKFAKEMHGKKPNFKFVNYDTVMADVVNNNRNALTGKVGFKNVMWAMKVVAFG